MDTPHLRLRHLCLSRRLVRAAPWAAILVLAALLRCDGLDQSFWLDELHTAWAAGGDWADIAGRARQGNNGPLYFYGMWLLGRVDGPSEVLLRLPSVLAGTALVGLLAVVVARWTGQQAAGLAAGLLAACDRPSLFYAGEARPYALVQLVAVAVVALFVELLRSPTLWLRAGFVAGCAVLFHLHVTSGLLIAALAVAYGAVCLWPSGQGAELVPDRRLPYRPAVAGLDFLLIGVACLPAWPLLTTLVERRANWAVFIRSPALGRLFTLFRWEIYVLVPAAVFLGRRVGTRPAAVEESPCSRGRETSGRTLTSSATGAGTVMTSWMAVPLFVAWCLSRLDGARLFFGRYLIASAVAPIALGMTLLFAARLSKFRTGAIVLGLGAWSVWTSQIVENRMHHGRFIPDRTEDWRGAVQFLSQAAADRCPVFVGSGLIEAQAADLAADASLRDYCLFPVRGPYRVDESRHLLWPLPTWDTGEFDTRAASAARDATGAWLLLRADLSAAERTAQRIARHLAPARVTDRKEFGRVVVMRLEVAPHRK